MERSHMGRMKLSFGEFHGANISRLAALVILLAGCFPAGSLAQQPGQKTFSSAEEASKAFVAAAERNDEKAMLEILGPDGKQTVSSGDHLPVYRRRKLAHANTHHEKRRWVAFRY
jgi:hypothetical protein